MEEVLLKFKKTRKAFIPEYICGFFLLFVFVMGYFKQVNLSKIVSLIVLALSIISFVSAEAMRGITRYKITAEKVIITHGILVKNTKNIHFHPLGFVPDINAHQNFWQRLLNYGTVFIQGTGESQLVIRDIDNPHGILKVIEQQIEKNRTAGGKRKFG